MHRRSEFVYTTTEPAHTHAYLMPPVLEVLTARNWSGRSRRVFELGCGNGATATELARNGFEVVGVDPSGTGIALANGNRPDLKLSLGSDADDLAGRFGQFPVVISLEVIEHVFLPRRFAACLYSLLEPGGIAIISTPYHGYLKNLALSLAGKMDQHFTALWDYGHIKFWSVKTLGALLAEAGFRDIRFRRIGRIPPLAKSMIAVATRPGTSGHA